MRPSRLNRLGFLRNNYRAAMPALATTFDRMQVDADVVVCSSSGWAHGVGTWGRKVVYCHNPARWLYQPDEFFAGGQPHWRLASATMRPYLLRWDRCAAASAQRYLVNSSVVAERVRDIYGIDATVVPPPVRLDAAGPQEAIAGIEGGFLLSVGRLLGYKNVQRVIDAVRLLPGQRLRDRGRRARARRARAGLPTQRDLHRPGERGRAPVAVRELPRVRVGVDRGLRPHAHRGRAVRQAGCAAAQRRVPRRGGGRGDGGVLRPAGAGRDRPPRSAPS